MIWNWLCRPGWHLQRFTSAPDPCPPGSAGIKGCATMPDCCWFQGFFSRSPTCCGSFVYTVLCSWRVACVYPFRSYLGSANRKHARTPVHLKMPWLTLDWALLNLPLLAHTPGPSTIDCRCKNHRSHDKGKRHRLFWSHFVWPGNTDLDYPK